MHLDLFMKCSSPVCRRANQKVPNHTERTSMFLRSDGYLEAERGDARVAVGPFFVEHSVWTDA